MKKILVLTILLACVLSCAFANSNDFSTYGKMKANRTTLSVKVSPYSFQYIQYGKGYSSQYGFGAVVGSTFNMWKDFYLKTDIKYSNYRYDKLDNRYTLLSFSPRLGWYRQIGETSNIEINLGPAVQARFIGKDKGLFLGANLYLGAGFTIERKFTFTVGAELGVAFQKDSRDYSAETLLGFEVVL